MKRSGLRQVTRSSGDTRHDVASRHAAAYGRSSTLPICDVQSNPVDLGSRLVSPERALAAIRAGSRIYIGTGCAAPRTLLARLEAMEPGPADLELVSFLTTSGLPQVAGSPRTRYHHRTFFVGIEVRDLAGRGQLDDVL